VEWRAEYTTQPTVATVEVELIVSFWEYVRSSSGHSTTWSLSAVSGQNAPSDSSPFTAVVSIVTETDSLYNDEWRETAIDRTVTLPVNSGDTYVYVRLYGTDDPNGMEDRVPIAFNNISVKSVSSATPTPPSPPMPPSNTPTPTGVTATPQPPSNTPVTVTPGSAPVSATTVSLLTSVIASTTSAPSIFVKHSSRAGMPLGVIIGAAIGACVAVTLIILCIVCLCRRRNRDREPDGDDMTTMDRSSTKSAASYDRPGSTIEMSEDKMYKSQGYVASGGSEGSASGYVNLAKKPSHYVGASAFGDGETAIPPSSDYELIPTGLKRRSTHEPSDAPSTPYAALGEDRFDRYK